MIEEPSDIECALRRNKVAFPSPNLPVQISEGAEEGKEFFPRGHVL